MIVRIVKMKFDPDKVCDFLEIFKISKNKIINFDGCKQLNLLRDQQEKNVFFTYSHWDSEEFLNLYRDSELFQTTWSKTKALFSAKPEAWTVKEVEIPGKK